MALKNTMIVTARELVPGDVLATLFWYDNVNDALQAMKEYNDDRDDLVISITHNINDPGFLTVTCLISGVTKIQTNRYQPQEYLIVRNR